jgi:hypothetical protein
MTNQGPLYLLSFTALALASCSSTPHAGRDAGGADASVTGTFGAGGSDRGGNPGKGGVTGGGGSGGGSTADASIGSGGVGGAGGTTATCAARGESCAGRSCCGALTCSNAMGSSICLESYRPPVDSGAGGTGGAGGSASAGGAITTGGVTNKGGATASGGIVGTGGIIATGGRIGTGGATVTGGVVGAGGIHGTGGTTITGGAIAAGGGTGRGGAPVSGGSVGTGGTVATGGAIATGGSIGTGGTTGVGGSIGTGGTTGVGGSTGTGGTTGVGGSTGTGGAAATGGVTGAGGSGGGALTWEFTTDTEGWSGEFCDYPPGTGTGYELSYGWAALPASLGSGGGLRQGGNNHSDDLFSYVKHQLTGLSPGTTYRLDIAVIIGTNAPSDCGGIGGSPGTSVFFKIGASTVEPLAALDSRGYLRLNIDKGNQSQGGVDMHVLGHIGNSNTCPNDTYQSKTFTLSSFPVTSSSSGGVWIIAGTDSGFEGITTIYYDRIAVTATRVP